MARKSEEDLRAIEAGLDRIVRKQIEERLGSYLQAERASLSQKGFPNAGTGYELKPSNPTAASISIYVCGGEITVDVGHGSFDLWHADYTWRETLAQVLDAVAEGRYRESVSQGWIFERKVGMRFEGTTFSPSYARLTYDDDDVSPEPGEHTYDAW